MNWRQRHVCQNQYPLHSKTCVDKRNSRDRRYVSCIVASKRYVYARLFWRMSQMHLNNSFVCLFPAKSQECPEGVVHEDCFKDIYAKFFPHGSKYTTKCEWSAMCLIQLICILQIVLTLHISNDKTELFTYTTHLSLTLLFPHPDSSFYAHYVFRAFDVNCCGSISFRVSADCNIEHNYCLPGNHFPNKKNSNIYFLAFTHRIC